MEMKRHTKAEYKEKIGKGSQKNSSIWQWEINAKKEALGRSDNIEKVDNCFTTPASDCKKTVHLVKDEVLKQQTGAAGAF